MTIERAPEAHQRSSAYVPSGLRRLSPAMLATERTGEQFKGLPETGATTPSRMLAAFKAAAPALGYGPRVVHAIDWLFSFTQPQDWAAESRPVVWPSAALQRDALGLGITQAKALNRYLVELGLVVMRDSPNGKRYGKRDKAGRIVEAYGFDLAPLAARLAEFQSVAHQARQEREAMRRLRRRATIARKALQQILETVTELGLSDEAWQRLADEVGILSRALSKVEMLDEMEIGVASLERRQREARERLESATNPAPTEVPEAVDSDPKGPENRPHYYSYKPPFNPQEDTVIASERSKSGVEASPHPVSQAPRVRQEEPTKRPVRTDSGAVMKLTTDELVKLAPRLKPYLRNAAPGWPDIVEAADWLRHDLGVSKPLGGEACLAMGRELAAVALAIVSAKPPEHFTASPGGYFYGMVSRAKAGTLNLSRSVWALRHGTARASRPKRTQ